MCTCKECGKKSYKEDVCTNCGLVVSEVILSKYRNRMKDTKTTTIYYDGIFMPVLSPKSEFLRKRTFKSKIKEYYDKTSDDYKYMKAYSTISYYCSILQLPNTVTREALNLYINVRKKDSKFFVSHDLVPSYMAFIRIACRINSYYVNRDSIFELEPHKWNAKKLWEIYQKNITDKTMKWKHFMCPHCMKKYKNEIGLKRHLNNLEKRGIRKKFNKAYVDILNLLGLNLHKKKYMRYKK